jgi:hypothetical protein
LTTERDVYANLLKDTRGLRRDQASAREVWFARLEVEHKEDVLFELEMLLKGFACFRNARNLPGRERAAPTVTLDYHEHLRIVRDALAQSVELVRQLQGGRDQEYQFSRYLESVIPADAERSKLMQEQLTQDSPEESLFVLRTAFDGQIEIADGLLRLGRIPHRLYFAVLRSVIREVGRNSFFNPLVALEFRAEFDRIRSTEVLEALNAVPSEAAHRVIALAFLTLFRGLRYLSLLHDYCGEPATTRLSYLMLSVFRSDLRALTHFLERRAGDTMADGFERELFAIRAVELMEHRKLLAEAATSLISLRDSLDTTVSSLRREISTGFLKDLPSADAGLPTAELSDHFRQASASLQSSLTQAIQALCAELAPTKGAPKLSLDQSARRAGSLRLRRDVWMFAQILRAFLAKAEAASGNTDRWASYASFQFVREFLIHFRAIGYQLLRLSDYERLDPFLKAIESLRESDLLDPARMEKAVRECAQLSDYLTQLFDQISRRTEIKEVPFDKREAAESLRIYLGAS